MLIGPPGVGKSKAIGPINGFVKELDNFHIGPTSVTGASLVDSMYQARREIFAEGKPTSSFNSLFIMAHDLQSTLHKNDQELIAVLTVFYDTEPYRRTRHVEASNIVIENPTLSMLTGTTPSNLLTILPQTAWEQGFMSRVIMVYCSERVIRPDIFASPETQPREDLEHDLQCIFDLEGEFDRDDAFSNAYNAWRQAGCPPVPTHPRLLSYNPRRGAHLLKLAMVSSADRSDSLVLNQADFFRALGWMKEAEATMPQVFTGPQTNDAKALDEIVHLMGDGDVIGKKLMRLVSDKVPINQVNKTIEILQQSGRIKVAHITKGQPYYRREE